MSASSNIRVPPRSHTILKYITKEINIKSYLFNYILNFNFLFLFALTLYATSLLLFGNIKYKTSDNTQEVVENQIPGQIFLLIIGYFKCY